MEELRLSECHTLKCIAEVDSTACKSIILRHGVGQLKHSATGTMWAQRILHQEGIEVRRSTIGRLCWWCFRISEMSLRYPCLKSFHPSLFPGHSGFHAMVVRHLSELISATDGGENRQVLLRRPGASRTLCGEILLGGEPTPWLAVAVVTKFHATMQCVPSSSALPPSILPPRWSRKNLAIC